MQSVVTRQSRCCNQLTAAESAAAAQSVHCCRLRGSSPDKMPSSSTDTSLTATKRSSSSGGGVSCQFVQSTASTDHHWQPAVNLVCIHSLDILPTSTNKFICFCLCLFVGYHDKFRKVVDEFFWTGEMYDVWQQLVRFWQEKKKS